MQEKQIIIMDQKKVKLIASSRLATCYHPPPEGMGILAGISIKKYMCTPKYTKKFCCLRHFDYLCICNKTYYRSWQNIRWISREVLAE